MEITPRIPLPRRSQTKSCSSPTSDDGPGACRRPRPEAEGAAELSETMSGAQAMDVDKGDGADGSSARDVDDSTLFSSGPLSVLTHAVKANEPVLISCRHNRKLLCRVKAFDRHCNMVLENVQELWTEVQKTSSGKKKAKPMERFIPKMFLRGDSVVLVVRNPA